MRRREFMLNASAGLVLASCQRTPAETTLPAAYAPVQDAIQQSLKPGSLPGAVWLVARGDDVVAQAVGAKAIGSQAPMARDTIFRIASMTKAVTAAAVMMLIEEGKLALDDRAEQLLPELANPRVLRTPQSELDDTVPASSPITIRQIMNFTFGAGISLDPSIPIMRAGQEQQLTLAEPTPMTPHAPDEWMRRFGALPLMAQPGERWFYNGGSLLQGVLVRRASGMDFDTFVQERITDPLGMRDTGFYVPEDKLDRFAGCGAFTNPQAQEQVRMDQDGAQSAYARRPIFPSGAGGMVSTIDDYLAFARMLKAREAHGAQRILSAQSVVLMTTNQLSQEQRVASAESLFPGFFETNGWGYGMAVQVSPDQVTHIPGTYGWDGGFGSTFFVDPDRDVIAIAMTQSGDFLFNGAKERFRAAIYQAIA